MLLVRPDWGQSGLFRGGRIYGGACAAPAGPVPGWRAPAPARSCLHLSRRRCPWRTLVHTAGISILPSHVHRLLQSRQRPTCASAAPAGSLDLHCLPATCPITAQAPTTRPRRTSTSAALAWSTCGSRGASQTCCTCTSGRRQRWPCWCVPPGWQWLLGQHGCCVFCHCWSCHVQQRRPCWGAGLALAPPRRAAPPPDHLRAARASSPTPPAVLGRAGAVCAGHAADARRHDHPQL